MNGFEKREGGWEWGEEGEEGVEGGGGGGGRGIGDKRPHSAASWGPPFMSDIIAVVILRRNVVHSTLHSKPQPRT